MPVITSSKPDPTATQQSSADVEKASEDESNSSTSTPKSDFQTRTEQERNQEEELVRQESVDVNRSKRIVIGVILLAATAGGIAASQFATKDEKNAFETEFETFAKEIAKVSDFTADRAFSVIQSLSKSITATALSQTNTSFPFFTMPFFHEQGGQTQRISGAEVVVFAPLVKENQKEAYEEYVRRNSGWLQEGLAHRGMSDVDPGPIPDQIHQYVDPHVHKPGQMHVGDYYLPVWQIAAAPTNATIMNFDLMTRSSFEHTLVDVIESRKGILSDICDFSYLTEFSYVVDDGITVHPQSYILEPVYKSFEPLAPVVGFVVAVFPWNNYFRNILPETVEGVQVVVSDQCGDIHTYTINGPDIEYTAGADTHDLSYDDLKYSVNFAEFARFDGIHPNEEAFMDEFGMSYTEFHKDTSKGHCLYQLDVYPSEVLEAEYTTNRPVAYAAMVVAIFGFILVLLFVYDCMVARRQKKLLLSAQQTNAIVSSLFPKSVTKRIMEEQSSKQKHEGSSAVSSFMGHNGGGNDEMYAFGSKPIADFFPETTIMFADLAGFTAWSSTREPTQVFSLLETIYHAFDDIARSRGVFKVETVGDCYVAAAGLPEPRANHAIVMAKYARDCLYKFRKLAAKMEVVLGPDTGDLGLRVGIHSGPVTAGVLRGERSRFQIFGDTVNTTSRMESTGMKNKIHLSQTTANILEASGLKGSIWPRDDLVSAKGKGNMQTFWLATRFHLPSEQSTHKESSVSSDSPDVLEAAIGAANTRMNKETRSIGWNVEMLSRLLKQVVAMGTEPDKKELQIARGETVLEEVQESITLPAAAVMYKCDPNTVDLGPEVESQLRDFVTQIAFMYRSNPFHSFEHASHVIMSVTKLLSRIVAPDAIDYHDMCYKNVETSTLHDYTYGITSDPLTQFACAFSALIHDVDHTGVPNAQLVKEKTDMAKLYNNKSVAEQNSVDLAWDLLMEPQFKDLRSSIFKTQAELVRFRQLVVNSVMATDIADKELGALRKKRWEKAFSKSMDTPPDESAVVEEEGLSAEERIKNRKATIVIEYLIQASDVAHTMQHWHVYIKWNRRLFLELYRGYEHGRANSDPSEGWYKGELGFFDFYIIPLAKKLKECGVFGVSSDEYLKYAEDNRREWEIKGLDIVAGYLEECRGEQKSSLTLK